MNKSFARRISGRQAQRNGANFESALHTEALRNGWHVLRIHMGARFVSAVKIIKLKNPFDYIFLKDSKVIFCDAKTTKAKNYTYSMITVHQLKDLHACAKAGQTAGYIVNFTAANKTVFFAGTQLASLKPGQSLKPEDGVLIGGNNLMTLDRIFVPGPNAEQAKNV